MYFRCARITYGLLICIVWTQGIYCDDKYNFCKDKGCVTGKYNGNQKESDKTTENANLYDKKKVKEKLKSDEKEKRNNYGTIYNDKFSKYATKRTEGLITDNKSGEHEKTRKLTEKIKDLQGQLDYLNSKNKVPNGDLISRGKKSTNGKKLYVVELTPVAKTEDADNGNKVYSDKIYKKYRRIRKERETERQNKKEALFKNWRTFKRITKKPAKPDKTR